jgi:outer membrane lipase/esterase
MTTRRRWHIATLAAAALIVAGCGGGSTDDTIASRVIAFGDSLSDVGTYTPATSVNGLTAGTAPYFGGKFTTNAHTGYTTASNTSIANTWVEWVSARLGVAITPAEVGFATTRVPCPAAATGLAATCTGYAQGGSRVTDPIGIGKTAGALTIPIVQQIASHNTRTIPGFTMGFGKDDIVFVWGGNNDVFTQFGAVLQANLPPATADANVRTAGTELATLVKDEIIAKGGRQVAVLTLPDGATSPFGRSLPSDSARALLTQLSAAFNTALLAGLEGSSARIIDARAIISAIQAAPTAYGLTNVTDPACNVSVISAITSGLITAGSPFTSLFCNGAPAAQFTAAGLPSLNAINVGASTSTYLFADGNHPTIGGHKVFGDQVWAALKTFGWVPENL